jgi:hypothetical protein
MKKEWPKGWQVERLLSPPSTLQIFAARNIDGCQL